MKKTSLISAMALSLGLLTAGAANATSFNIEMVVDNDFAVFSGTSTGINNLLYQNNAVWWDQIPQLSNLNFNLASGDNMLYVLAMGGGWQENVSGKVNGVNITSVPVSMSSDVSSFLSGYFTNLNNVAYGSYNASLTDAQTAFANATWSAPALNTTDVVIQSAGFGSGYHFDDSTAHFFSFEAADVGVPTSVPEPAGLALFGLGLLGLVAARRRKAV